MPYEEWDSDWSRRQPAGIDDAELFVLRIPVERPDALAELCEQRVNRPSNRRIKATPWAPLSGAVAPFVLFAAARFSGIRSGDPDEPLRGSIDEHDIGFFIPVRVEVENHPQGVYALNPFIYVDNPAGMIMGREIFGFGKIHGEIEYQPEWLEFGLRSLVFRRNHQTEPATIQRILELRRDGREPFRAFDPGEMAPFGTLPATKAEEISAFTGGLAASLFFGEERTSALPLPGFVDVRLPLLKQYRSVEPGTGSACQEVVRATFEIVTLRGARILPGSLFGRTPLLLHLFPHASVDIQGALGLGAGPLRPTHGVAVRCQLRLTGSRFS
jgi:hypothetical protein